MRKQLVYDLPLRLFHWLFAGLFILAFVIAKSVDDESSIYSYHMLAGILLGFTVTLRIIWGIVGTRYSRFSSFALHPMDFVNYFKEIISGYKNKWSGHNPASSWAALTMFALALGLSITGYLMANGHKETYEDIHELFANGFLVIVLMHVAGIVIHSIRYRDGIGFSMLDGAKSEISDAESISNSRPGVAIIFIALVATFFLYLVQNFDSQKQTLHFFGTVLQLGENEDGEVKQENSNDDKEHDDDDDDDD